MGDEVSKSAKGRVNKSVERECRLKGKEKKGKKTIEVSVASVRSVDEMWEVLYERVEHAEREQRTKERKYTYIDGCLILGVLLQLCGIANIPVLYEVQSILRVIGLLLGVIGLAGLVLGWVEVNCKMEYVRLTCLGIVASVVLSLLCGSIGQGVFLAVLLSYLLLIMRLATEGSKRQQLLELGGRWRGDIVLKGVTQETAEEWQKVIQDVKSVGKVNIQGEEEENEEK